MRAYPRSRKLNESVKEAVADILEKEVSDPRLTLVTVTSADVSRDMRFADVYVTTHGDRERYDAMLQGLESAKGRIRTAVGRRVKMKYVPELRFHVDSSVDEGMRISEVIARERREGTGGGDAEGGPGPDTGEADGD